MSHGCTYANQCMLYKNFQGVSPTLRKVFKEQLCSNKDNAQRCRRAQYHAVYGDDPPLSMLPLPVNPEGGIWLRG
ncbi:hypothetical protein Desaf_2442 [Desulfocurvibacter africanus subsp. africanus str. Walvis Bay]|uniref:Uncharacterized protein n=1 Tax=Desulfocurvibacter africanus subsp. africanus str. Walvis Bay TaxID=690850 RepID=F3YYL1_DESAF|nr:hypothetical protein Desaf_2442 [Desulfocurvibacter africanus subsp. africanus str. Walvis Bay]